MSAVARPSDGSQTANEFAWIATRATVGAPLPRTWSTAAAMAAKSTARTAARRRRRDTRDACDLAGVGGNRRKRFLRNDLDEPNRLGDPFNLHRPTPLEPQPFHPPCQMDRALARQYLARLGDRTQPCCEVQRAAAIAALRGHGLACIQAHSDAQRKRRLVSSRNAQPPLQLDGCAQRLPSRAEHAQHPITR
jgi:hypothetical protein